MCRIYPALFPPRAAARSLLRAPSVRLEIGDSRCPTCRAAVISKDLAARQNGTTVGAVAKSQKFFVTLEQDEDGWFVAKCPGLPGCVSQGKTREEAIANIREAIEGSLETRAANSIPSNIETIEIEILVAWSAVLPVCSGAAARASFHQSRLGCGSAAWQPRHAEKGRFERGVVYSAASAAWEGSLAVADCRFRAQCRGVCEVSLSPSPSLFVRPALTRTLVTATFSL